MRPFRRLLAASLILAGLSSPATAGALVSYATIGSMPERTLPRVGKVKLFSLSAQNPCQARYGLIESNACPVSPEIQDRPEDDLGPFRKAFEEK